MEQDDERRLGAGGVRVRNEDGDIAAADVDERVGGSTRGGAGVDDRRVRFVVPGELDGAIEDLRVGCRGQRRMGG